tara:strand:+ start:79 stop:384 length:306 start_codon:yes stop_codon:yes gene_type:complete
MKFNKILDYLSKVNLDEDKKISKYLEMIKDKGKSVTNRSIKELEIKKIELELAKEYYNLGNYVSKKYYSDKTLDFSYDEEYKSMNKKITSIKNYINKLEKN